MPRKQKLHDALATLLEAAPAKTLSDLVIRLASTRPDVRRECFDFLKKHISLSAQQKKQSDGEVLLALWSELAPDLDELDSYGGGDYGMVDDVATLLHEIEKKLSGKNNIEAVFRHKLLENILPYIRSGNAGLDDALYDVAYATCYDDNDLRALAEAFERMPGGWKTDHARHIYRTLGDRDKYLELRSQKMALGADYHDLADFYWKTGEKDKAMQVAEEGLRKAEGRMDELRQFVAQRVKSAGNRERYLDLQFTQATEHLTCDKYKAFRKLCTKTEWHKYEAKVLARLNNAWDEEQIKIRMHRKEYEKAAAVLTKGRYPLAAWDSHYEVQTAKRLERRFPEKILKYYLSGLENMETKTTRKEYAQKAKVMVKIQRLLVEVLNDKARWRALALKIKQDNIKRPALQEEFAKAVPGWWELK